MVEEDGLPKKRDWVYVLRPKAFEMAPCSCGNDDPDWSEYKGRLWCPKCKIDFIPDHSGILDGPVPVELSETLGIYFDRIDLKTNALLPDWEGKSHFSMNGKTILGRIEPQTHGEKEDEQE